MTVGTEVFPVCRDGSLLVRPYEVHDSPAMAALMNESGAAINGPGARFFSESLSPTDHAQCMRSLRWRHEALPAVVMLDEEYVGFTSLWNGRRPVAELMYWIGAQRQGQGLGSRMLRAVTPAVLADHMAVELRIAPSNEASQRTAAAAGYALVRRASESGGYNTWRHIR